LGKIYESFSDTETFSIGKMLGEKARPGQVYCLAGDLGVGKTVFSKGFAEGVGVTSTVSSPTFTIVHSYDEGRCSFHHFDVYRISDADEMYEIGFEEYIGGEGICLIEWANLIDDILPEDKITVDISKNLEKGTDYRKIEVSGLE